MSAVSKKYYNLFNWYFGSTNQDPLTFLVSLLPHVSANVLARFVCVGGGPGPKTNLRGLKLAIHVFSHATSGPRLKIASSPTTKTTTPHYDTTRHTTSRHATPRHDTTYHATPRHDTTCHATPRHDTTCHTTPRHDTLHHTTTRHATPRHTTPHHTTKRHATPHNATTRHAMPPADIISHQLVAWNEWWKQIVTFARAGSAVTNIRAEQRSLPTCWPPKRSKFASCPARNWIKSVLRSENATWAGHNRS